MTETINETLLDDELTDESLDRTAGGKICYCRGRDMRACVINCV